MSDVKYNAPTVAERDRLIRQAVDAVELPDEAPRAEHRAGLLDRLGVGSVEELAGILGIHPSSIRNYMEGLSSASDPLVGSIIRKVDFASRHVKAQGEHT